MATAGTTEDAQGIETPPILSAAPHSDSRPGRKGRTRASPGRHVRKCSVCRHPDRDALEQEFLRWRSPEALARDYGISDHSSIYRHAHATGLFARRRASIRLALGSLIEQAESVPVTAADVVNAVRVYAHINDAGEWIESNAVQPRPPASGARLPEPNRQPVRVEHAPTR